MVSFVETGAEEGRGRFSDLVSNGSGCRGLKNIITKIPPITYILAYVFLAADRKPLCPPVAYLVPSEKTL